MVKEVPAAYVATMTKAVRHGKIFIDFFRNDYTATAVADFSVRARPGTPVAVPLEWRELKGLKAANQFSIDDVLRRIKEKASGFGTLSGKAAHSAQISVILGAPPHRELGFILPCTNAPDRSVLPCRVGHT